MSGKFGHYEVLTEIGRGGMGIIYKARDPRLNRTVAIKQLVLEHVDPDKKDEFRERFHREAILAAGLNHPNCIAVYDVSISGDHNYYVMEYLDGHSLRKELEIRPQLRVPPDELLPILRQVCDGLFHAHEMNLVHRDIKPDNIFLLPDGKVKLTDFGIARGSEPENSNLTKPGVMLGTLSYVSPEQLQDARNVDHRADLYSLGVVMYEALAGQLPFTGEGLTSTLMAIVSREAKPVHEVNPKISPEMAAVVQRAMRKAAKDRFASAKEMLQAYEAALNPGGAETHAGMTTGSRQSSQSSEYTSGTHLRPIQTGTSPPTPPQQQPVYMPGLPMTPTHRATTRTGDDSGNFTPHKPWQAHKQEPAPESGSNTSLARAVGSIGRNGEEKGAFLEPAIVYARYSKIIVADTSKRNFQIFSRDGRFVAQSTPNPQIKGTKTAGGAFSKPSAVTVDGRGRIYACDNSDHYIRVFDGTGKFIREFHNRQGAGKEGGIQGVCVDAQGMIYISDADNGCVQVLQQETGTWVRKVGSKGHADGQLQLPSGLTMDRFGQLYVVDYGSSKVSVFSKAGLFQRSFGGKGVAPGLFNVPRGIAIDKFDRVYVADSLNHRVQVFNTAGDFLFYFGGRGNELGRFLGPSDLSIDPDNNCLYVADRGNQRIQIFELLSS